jgi:hypothetical protein
LTIYNTINKRPTNTPSATPPTGDDAHSMKEQITKDLVNAAERESAFSEPKDK